MSPQPGLRSTDEPSLASVLQHMLERDSRNTETMQLVLQRLGDQGGALQGLQLEVSRLVTIAEKQVSYNERQLAIDERTAGYRDRIERAEERIENLTTGAAGGKGAMRVLVVMLSVGFPALLGLFTYFNATLIDKIADAKTDALSAVAELKERHTADMVTATAQREAIRADVRELQQARAMK
jgi:hypothetical protein